MARIVFSFVLILTLVVTWTETIQSSCKETYIICNYSRSRNFLCNFCSETIFKQALSLPYVESILWNIKPRIWLNGFSVFENVFRIHKVHCFVSITYSKLSRNAHICQTFFNIFFISLKPMNNSSCKTSYSEVYLKKQAGFYIFDNTESTLPWIWNCFQTD